MTTRHSFLCRSIALANNNENQKVKQKTHTHTHEVFTYVTLCVFRCASNRFAHVIRIHIHYTHKCVIQYR